MGDVIRRGLTVACLALAPGAAVAGPDAWMRCDGYAKPFSARDNEGRMLLGYASMGPAITRQYFHDPEARERGAAGVAACDQALSSPDPRPDTWPRQVSLRVARGIHNQEAGDTAAAVADAEAAERLIVEHGAATPADRRTEAGPDLLSAYLRVRQGQPGQAAAFAVRALTARPYSSRALRLALSVLSLDPAQGSEMIEAADRLARIDPNSRAATAGALWRMGRFSEAWAEFAPEFGPGSAWSARDDGVLDPDTLQRSHLAAYAAARAGLPDVARGLIEASRKRVESAKAILVLKPQSGPRPSAAEADRRRPALLADGERWAAIVAGAGAGAPPPVETEVGDPIEMAGRDLFAALPQAQDPRSLVRFASDPGRASALGALSSSVQADGSARVQVSVPIFDADELDELALLAAANLAAKAGKPGFQVEGRSDLIEEQGPGRVHSLFNTPLAYQTILRIRFTDTLADRTTLATEEVLGSLEPVYATSP